MLEFFLSQQEKITRIQKNSHSIDELKEQCEKIILSKNFQSHLPQILDENKELNLIPHFIPDEDYCHLFQNKKSPFNTEKEKLSEKIFALFSSPLSDNWKEIMARKGDGYFALRTGFYQDEYEIYKSILMGFQGLTIYVTGLDCFQIQYLTEVARDFSFSILFVVHNKDELKLVLETDAPYLLFSTFEKKNFSIKSCILYNLSQFVPKTASLFAMSSCHILQDKKILSELGYRGLIVS